MPVLAPHAIMFRVLHLEARLHCMQTTPTFPQLDSCSSQKQVPGSPFIEHRICSQNLRREMGELNISHRLPRFYCIPVQGRQSHAENVS